MDAKTLIDFLNYSKTLIQNGELQCLVYRNLPVHPDDTGKEHRSMLAMWEKQLRENPPKSKNPEALRKVILEYLEEEKKYGRFWDNYRIFFSELNIVFQVLPKEEEPFPRYACRVNLVHLFDNYLSLAHKRFFSGNHQYYWLSNGAESLTGIHAYQFSNTRHIGTLERTEENVPLQLMETAYLPPSRQIDKTHAEVHLTETDTGETVYIITHIPDEKIKEKVYVRLTDGVPEVFREEFYYRSNSPNADAEGYWLRLVKMYRDFERVEALNLAFPKVREKQEFRGKDGFMRMHALLTITDMDFNLEFPVNFFDWDESALIGDSGRRRRVDDVPTFKEATK